MAPPPMENALHLGFHFDPKARDVVNYFLPILIAGQPMHVCIRPYIHATDIYRCEPGVLAARFRPTPVTGDRFFFTTCKRQPQKDGKNFRAHRAAGPGSWHTQIATTDVTDGDGVKIGELRKLRYKKGNLSTDWLMDEISSCHPGTIVGGDRQYVFCKIYVSPRAAADSAARQDSDAFTLAPLPAPPPQPPVEPVADPNMRPAAPPVAEPPRKRIRDAAVTTTFPSQRRCVPPMMADRNKTSGVFMPLRPEDPAVAAPYKTSAPPMIAKTQCGKRVSGAPVAPILPPPPAGSATPCPSPRPGMPCSSTVPMTMQPGRSPAPATPRPSYQQQPPAPLDLLSNEDPAQAEDEDLNQFANLLEDSLEVIEEEHQVPVQAEEEHQVPVPQNQAANDDDFNRFANSLDDLVDEKGRKILPVSDEGHQNEAYDDGGMDQFPRSFYDLPDAEADAEVHKELDPFAAAWANDEE